MIFPPGWVHGWWWRYIWCPHRTESTLIWLHFKALHQSKAYHNDDEDYHDETPQSLPTWQSTSDDNVDCVLLQTHTWTLRWLQFTILRHRGDVNDADNNVKDDDDSDVENRYCKLESNDLLRRGQLPHKESQIIDLQNKLADLEATLVQNYDRPTEWPTDRDEV